MNKKITVLTILVLVVSVFIVFARKDARQELYLKAVAEKDLATKMQLLNQYVQTYGQKKDKFLKFIYLNLANTAYKMKDYNETIKWGETSLENNPEIQANNKLNLLFNLANSYYITKKDLDKALNLAEQIVDTASKLIEQLQQSEQDPEKVEKMVENYRKFYMAPAYRLQTRILFARGKDNVDDIVLAAQRALKAYENDGSENSVKMAFSLAVNLSKKGKFKESLEVAEKIIDKDSPTFNHAMFLAKVFNRLKNKNQAVHYYELAYKSKRQLDLAMRIGRLIHKTNTQKGIYYFADAFVMQGEDKETDAYKFLEHLFFNVYSKGKTDEEKEQDFKALLNKARARFGKTTTEEAAAPVE